MKVFSGKTGKKGFTMLEVVLTVAILTILLAIAVPGVVRLSRSLKIAKLDDLAREIYTAAQSRTISLSVSGQLPQTTTSGAAKSAGARAVAGDIWYVCKSTGSTAETDVLLPLGSIEEGVRQNYYIIEYNPVTAMIYGVYYWENEGNDFPTDGYGSIADTREARMNYDGGMVGYYGGGDVTRLPSDDTSAVTAELFNEEELYLKIKQGMDGGHSRTGKITVTVTDLDTGASRPITFHNEDEAGNGRDLYYDPMEKFYKLTLDSLNSNLRFSKLYPEESGAFHPGCNLKVTVSFKEDGKTAQEQHFFTNSLFASVQGAYMDNRTAYISYGRHLENLGVLWVYQDGTVPAAMSDHLNGVTKAVQTGDIDWKTSLESIGGTVDVTSFMPIVNGSLQAFDGGGNTIFHANVSGAIQDKLSGGIGLFGRFEGNSLQNVNLVNCTIKPTGGTVTPAYVGLLAGTVEPSGAVLCQVDNCHAYATEESGTFDCSIVMMPTGSDVEGAGGLFGSIQNTEMQKCSASLTEIFGSAQYAGGLAGRVLSGCQINECYADTGLWFEDPATGTSGWSGGLSGGTVGGLLGSVDGSLTLEKSYAVGWAANGTAYGLVGAGTGAPTIQKCYAALVNDAGIVGKLVPDGLNAEKISGCINYSGGYDDFNGLVVTGDPYVDKSKNEEATHAYGIKGEGGASPVYPFPRLSDMPHYGDWPQESVASIAYYEVYQEEGTTNYSIGYYYNESASNTLKGDEVEGKKYTVVMDGYMVLSSTDITTAPLSVEYNGDVIDGTSDANLKLRTAKDKFGDTVAGAITVDSKITIGGKSYYPMFLSSAMMDEGKNGYAKHGQYYQRLKVTTGGATGATIVDVYFNPYVAESEFIKPEPGTVPGAPAVSILRTARQVTAYSFDAMQNTAIGKITGDSSATVTHTLQLERNISLAGKTFKTDETIGGEKMACKDLSIPVGTSAAEPSVILALQGKTLTGTGEGSVVSSKNGVLKIQGQGTITAKMKSADTVMICMDNGVEGTLTNVTIDNRGNGGSSVSMGKNVTMVGCTVKN